MTISTKEHIILIHYYQNAIVATTLRYPDEVTDPSHFEEIRNLPEAGEEELALMTKIVNKLTADIDLSVFPDCYKERIEALIRSKMKGKVADMEEKRPKKPAAKSMMEALRETAESLKSHLRWKILLSMPNNSKSSTHDEYFGKDLNNRSRNHTLNQWRCNQMGILETCMQRWAILAFLVAISVGISIAANGGVTVQNNTPSNVGTNMASKISILSVNYTAEDQWVEISNNGTSNISFTDWKLINMMKAKTYSFPTGFSLIPGITVKVHSGQGNNTPTDLYNSKLAWDKTDTAILKDASGKIISSYPKSL